MRDEVFGSEEIKSSESNEIVERGHRGVAGGGGGPRGRGGGGGRVGLVDWDVFVGRFAGLCGQCTGGETVCTYHTTSGKISIR